MKFLISCLLLAAITFTSHAQSKLTIRGVVKDTTNIPLDYTSVLLLSPKDSALVAYTLTNKDGEYQFKNVEKQPLLIKATYMGYLPIQKELVLPETGDLEVEEIQLMPILQELYEVVVKAAKAPLMMRGDTLEYDASKFKVPPGATLEELLRKLPGIQIDKDGNIVAQGQQVQKVTVDGRRFFGGNTKMATQNLNAESISKLQLYDDKSEQSKLTGVEDGVKEKTLNVELKEEAKKGGFGKLSAAGGTDGRWSSNASFNKFDKVNQFSVIGYGNNVNQSGLSWDDLQEFKGSSSFQFGDTGDFGFNGSGGMNFISFSGGDNEESFEIPFNNLNSGYSNNQAIGINYNYLKDKKDFSSNYFYSRSDQTLESINSRTNFLQDNTSFTSTDQSLQNNMAGHHRVNLRFQNELDSANTITINAKGRLSSLTTSLASHQELIRSSTEQSQMDRNNQSDKWSGAFQGTAIYRHKFKKNGRNFAASISDTYSKADQNGIQKSVVDVMNSTDPNTYFRNLDQLNEALNGSNQVKSSLLFVEPIKKVFFWETFYNFSQSKSETNRKVYDVEASDTQELNPELSRFFDNTITYNRFGSSIRYANKGSNLSVGLAASNYRLNGQFSVVEGSEILGRVDKNYINFTPNVSYWKTMKGNKNINASYAMGVSPPNIADLQPYKDISNPLYIREGNPDLEPEVSHSFNTGYSMYDPATFINLRFSFNSTFYQNQVVQNQTIDPETFVTTYKAGNVSGGQRYYPYLGFGFPIVKTKANAYLSANPSYSKSLSLINSIETETQTYSNNFGVNLDLTPLEWLSLYTGSSFRLSKTKYEQNPSQNQDIINWSAYSNVNIKFPKDFYLDVKFNYSRYENESFGFDQKVPILNAFVYKQIGEAKKWEVRLSAYDIFKQNQTISQYAGQNYVSTGRIETLSRYFLLGVTYNMRGVEVKKYR
ncbi:outer membrane receptor protein involved in Fe transport [Algoriphagus ratkowskyi]|uniref:Outer membrane receptor protein involved in Fe transport n=1 Tax=Algoriphagus ratkowskyi TaxID=57028 RepID=A0A2W7RM85_9BACT|nr:outer membrane beta-barrel protein [Algoriphagus ratkowskyi]PZX59600.1 outer membrane receptor protein involved in Fe transport [Algoriphagus ratkowskyi]TXD78677.1 TonB-dependent receptor [Algoriphagus ratkowskyi]